MCPARRGRTQRSAAAGEDFPLLIYTQLSIVNSQLSYYTYPHDRHWKIFKRRTETQKT